MLGVLGWLGLIDAKGMWRFERYSLVLSAVVAALLTPGGDAYSMVMLAIPLFLLYNVSIGVVWLIERRRATLPTSGSPLVLVLATWSTGLAIAGSRSPDLVSAKLVLRARH